MKTRFDIIPKIENHLHLEGAIPHETLWILIQKYGGDKSHLVAPRGIEPRLPA